MEKIILSVPSMLWVLMLIGFMAHVLMKMMKHVGKGHKVMGFFNPKTNLSMVASLLMSSGLVIAGVITYPDNNLLAFGALGAGYLNNSLWTNIMGIVASRVKKEE
jgi:hypothetical protein